MAKAKVRSSSVDKFMDFVTDFYGKLGFPMLWTEEGRSGRELEIQFKSESGYFVSAHLVPQDDHIIFRDELGREEPMSPTKANLQRVKSWAASREGSDSSS